MMLETRFICKKGIGNISFFYIDGVKKLRVAYKKIILTNTFINSLNKNVCGPPQGMYPSERKTYVHTKSFTLMFRAPHL